MRFLVKVLRSPIENPVSSGRCFIAHWMRRRFVFNHSTGNSLGSLKTANAVGPKCGRVFIKNIESI